LGEVIRADCAPGRKGKSTAIEKAFGAVLRAWFSGALLGSDGVEHGPTLFYVIAATMRTEDFAFLVFGKRQHLWECFLAGVAVKLILRHWDLRVVVKGSS
jgi:hypothetical protein